MKHKPWLTPILTVLYLINITIFLSSCTTKPQPRIVLERGSYNHLSQWENDDHHQALVAFQKSCNEIQNRNPQTNFGNRPQFGKTADWQLICHEANNLNVADDKAAKTFFEKWFVPYSVKNNSEKNGLFTGYYLPVLHVSTEKDRRYRYPIYGMPNDLIRVNLQEFSQDLPKRTLTGRLANQTLVPYPDRSQINRGKIHNNAPVLFWSDNEIDLFFAQIQGSTIVELPDGKQYLLGYAGQNGQPYRAIGKILIDNHVLDKETISMQTIRAWLNEHPKEARNILNKNASYVFFSVLNTVDPIGSEQIPLTPKRSLAVDTNYIPLGAPLWLETALPDARTYQRLLIAQDTGGSIKGIVRGDIYWGPGNEAAAIAGQMKESGRYWVLLPRRLSQA